MGFLIKCNKGLVVSKVWAAFMNNFDRDTVPCDNLNNTLYLMLKKVGPPFLVSLLEIW